MEFLSLKDILILLSMIVLPALIGWFGTKPGTKFLYDDNKWHGDHRGSHHHH